MIKKLIKWLQSPMFQAAHDYANVYLKLLAEMKQLSKLFNIPLEHASILDVGCGYHYPNVILFTENGFKIEGLDIIDIFYRDNIIKIIKIYKFNLKQIIKILLKNIYFKMYYYYLQRFAEIDSINHNQYRLTTYDGKKMPYPDNSFDFVISNAVLEHVKDVYSFASEIYRVTKKGGCVIINYHNYYSFSGNHLDYELNRRYPWGHLTGELKEQIFLNKLNPEEVKEIFKSFFDKVWLYYLDEYHNTLRYDESSLPLCTESPHLFKWEGQNYLTPSLLRKIKSNYPEISEKLLLSKGFKVICVKT